MTERPVTNHAYLALSDVDFNTASKTCESVARETHQLVLVSYWKSRPHGALEFHVAASHDGVSTFVTVGTLNPDGAGFTPGAPIPWLRGTFGDPLVDILNAAALRLTKAVAGVCPGSLNRQGLQHLVTDTFSATCRDTLAATPGTTSAPAIP